MKRRTNVTPYFRYGDIDGELLPITRCICGAEWKPWSGMVLDWNDPTECPECGRKFTWSTSITIYEVL